MGSIRRRRPACRLTVESLEARTLLSASVSNQTLFVAGTHGDDIIRVFRSGGNIIVRENGSETSFDASQIRQIVVAGRRGDDRILIDDSILLPTTLRGGLGNDFLRGGRGSDELYGGPGDDLLAGRDNDDWLYGQAGRDELRGGPGRDLLRGGPGADRLRGGRDWDDYDHDDHDDVPGHELRERQGGRAKALETEYKVYMTGPGGVRGKAEYEVKRGAIVKRKFEVELYGATPGASYNVYVAGKLVGQVSVGPNGKGKLELTTHPDDPHDQPLPAGFPRVGDGTLVKIANLMSGRLRRWPS